MTSAVVPAFFFIYLSSHNASLSKVFGEEG